MYNLRSRKQRRILPNSADQLNTDGKLMRARQSATSQTLAVVQATYPFRCPQIERRGVVFILLVPIVFESDRIFFAIDVQTRRNGHGGIIDDVPIRRVLPTLHEYDTHSNGLADLRSSIEPYSSLAQRSDPPGRARHQSPLRSTAPPLDSEARSVGSSAIQHEWYQRHPAEILHWRRLTDEYCCRVTGSDPA